MSENTENVFYAIRKCPPDIFPDEAGKNMISQAMDNALAFEKSLVPGVSKYKARLVVEDDKNATPITRYRQCLLEVNSRVKAATDAYIQHEKYRIERDRYVCRLRGIKDLTDLTKMDPDKLITDMEVLMGLHKLEIEDIELSITHCEANMGRILEEIQRLCCEMNHFVALGKEIEENYKAGDIKDEMRMMVEGEDLDAFNTEAALENIRNRKIEAMMDDFTLQKDTAQRLQKRAQLGDTSGSVVQIPR